MGASSRINPTSQADPRCSFRCFRGNLPSGQHGRPIVYRNGSTLASAHPLQPFSAGAAQTLFSAPNLFAFDVTKDGKRLVAVTQAEDRENVDFVLVSGWFEDLKAKMRPSR